MTNRVESNTAQPGVEENLDYLLNPRSVAIVGVSRNPDSFGYPLVEIALKYGYSGNLYLVNPKADSILGLNCYSSILAISGEVDTVIIMVPRQFVAEAIGEAIEKKVRGIVVITAGFAEHSDEGRRLQEELVEKARARGIRMIGPNTLGYFSAASSLDLIMSGFIRKGHTGLITQSGNLTQSITFPGAQRGLGFSYVVGLGNQADLQAHDLIRYFRQDPRTRSIAVHIEGLVDGRRFIQEVRATVPHKPVVVLKSGRTETGAKVAASHTASMAGDDAIYQAAFRQAGAIPVENLSEMRSLLQAFNQGRMARGNRVCIISEGGGDCALTSDACERQGLTVPRLSESSRQQLRGFIPNNGSVLNPIDLAGWQNVAAATEIALADEQVDGVIVVGGFAGNFHISPRDYPVEELQVKRMCEVIAATDKPVTIYSYSGYCHSKFTELLQQHKIPLYMDHHDAVKAMTALFEYARIRQRTADRPFTAKPSSTTRPGLPSAATGSHMLEPVAKQWLDHYQLPYPPEGVAETPVEAVALAETIGYPVAMKIISPDILHKTEADCVKLGLSDREAVENNFTLIRQNAGKYNQQARIAGVLVSRMDTGDGLEVIIGGLRDPVFGPVVMFGIGGIMVELLQDVAFRICPLDPVDADEMMREIKGFSLLSGIRGRPALDLESIRDGLLKVSRMLIENPWIAEIDLNPVKVHRKGLFVLDARIITSQPGGAS